MENRNIGNMGTGAMTDKACVAEPTISQAIIDSLDNFIGNLKDANQRKRRIIDNVFGGDPCDPEPKPQPNAPGLKGEIGMRMEIMQRLLGESHQLIDRLSRIA